MGVIGVFVILAASLVAAEKKYVQDPVSKDGHNYRDPNGYKVFNTPANLGADMRKGLRPYNPVCSIETGEGVISVEESKGIGGEWGCLIRSNAESPYLVRVMTYQAEAAKEKDMDWDFYYVITKGERIVANSGKGSDTLRCRLCGAQKYYGPLEDTSKDTGRNKIENLEDYSANFQCSRECEAVIYKHRNFNAWSRTISSNEPNLNHFEGITTIKVAGDGCVVDLYSEESYGGQKVCSFRNDGDGSTVWDQDAMVENCAKSAVCAKGHDCAKSLAIRMDKRCGALASGATEPAKCPKCKLPKRNDLYEQSLNAATAHEKTQTLQLLFTAMAEVLEE